MLLLTGWKRQDSKLAAEEPCTLRMHLADATSHKQIVPSREQLTIKSFEADQSQPEKFKSYRITTSSINDRCINNFYNVIIYKPVTAFV